MTWEVREADCVEEMRGMEPDSIDAIVCDPPYGLEFMGKEWDRLTNHGFTDGAERRPSPSWSRSAWQNKRCRKCGHIASGGSPCRCENPEWEVEVGKSNLAALTSQKWHEAWATEALRILKPGGHLLAFGGTRTYHRLACAVEDAGFEIRDSLIWLYGSGFPKSLDVGKALDKAAGAEREVVGVYESPEGTSGRSDGSGVQVGAVGIGGLNAITAPATEEAKQWQGWGTALKPSHEPVICARKPLSLVTLDYGLLNDVHHALGGLVCLLSSANDAELASTSSQADSGAECVSARVSAYLENLSEGSGQTGTFKSPEAESIALSIVSSWSAILGELSPDGSKSTTETATRLTTALRTLSWSLSPITSLGTMPRCECLLNGERSSANGAKWSSTAEWRKWLNTLKRSALGSVIEPTAQSVAGVLASVAVESSSDPAVASSVQASATTPTETRTDAGTRPHTGGSSHEPVVVARKPLIGTVAANVLAHGTGALNIDGTRIEGPPRTTHANGHRSTGSGEGYGMAAYEADVPAGRWPANVILSESASEELDRQSGELHTQNPATRGNQREGSFFGGESHFNTGGFGDTGGASRFFYTAKASRSERNAGLEGFEASDEFRTQGAGRVPLSRCPEHGKSQPSGTTTYACGCARIWDGREGAPSPAANVHPTVKPIALMRWLVRLVTPPGGTVLDPFAGSGTTGCAAVLEDFNFIGIEREPEYAAIARARIAHWYAQPVQTDLFADAA